MASGWGVALVETEKRCHATERISIVPGRVRGTPRLAKEVRVAARCCDCSTRVGRIREDFLVHRVSDYVRSAASHLRVARNALIVTGALGATVVGAAAAAPAQAHGANLWFHRGYQIEGSWYCYGWSDGAYHCTQHWHRTSGGVVSDNPAWVPNYDGSSVAYTSSKKSNSVTRSAPVYHSASVSNFGASNPGQAGVIAEIRAVFGPYANQALTVARCESGFNPGARNPISVGGAHAAGVFQILDSSTWRSTSYAGQSPYNAYANIHAAYQIFQRDGYSWREWQCAS